MGNTPWQPYIRIECLCLDFSIEFPSFPKKILTACPFKTLLVQLTASRGPEALPQEKRVVQQQGKTLFDRSVKVSSSTRLVLAESCFSTDGNTMRRGPPCSDTRVHSFFPAQRNVGILEKIVQSMTTQKNSEEAAVQYNAQVDVIQRLAAKVDQQLSTQKKLEKNPTVKTALIKLERDFDRVKDRVAALQESVSKMRKQSAALRQQQAAAGVLNDPNKSEESMGYEEFQRHMELQLQQDVSAFAGEAEICFGYFQILTMLFDRDWRSKLCESGRKKFEKLIKACIR